MVMLTSREHGESCPHKLNYIESESRVASYTKPGFLDRPENLAPRETDFDTGGVGPLPSGPEAASSAGNGTVLWPSGNSRERCRVPRNRNVLVRFFPSRAPFQCLLGPGKRNQGCAGAWGCARAGRCWSRGSDTH